MTRPAVWQGDPACGHAVACAYQTHYCVYIRVPRLLTLQSHAGSLGYLALLSTNQWYELWYKVLVTDLRAALAGNGSTEQPVKLLRRGIELFRLLDQQADFAETVLVRELGMRQFLRGPLHSKQWGECESLAPGLERLAGVNSDLSETIPEYRARLAAWGCRYLALQTATLQSTADAALTYDEWLCLPELLLLQDGVKAGWALPDQDPAEWWKPETITPDENMFIIVHQAFELGFKVVLAHLDQAIAGLMQMDVAGATRLLRRVVHIERLLVSQIQMPATMLPHDFMQFREQQQEKDGREYRTGLAPASGTESYQFREIEIACGLRDDPAFRHYLAGTDRLPIRLLTPRQRERLEQPTLAEAFAHVLKERGVQLDRIFSPANAANPHADLAQLGNLLLDLDQFFYLWRVGHLSMVERMIGGRSGTGFLGPEYLAETAGLRLQGPNRIFIEPQVRPRFFPELWEARSRITSHSEPE